MSVGTDRLPAEWDAEIARSVIGVGEWDLLFDTLERAGCKLGVDGRLRALGLLGRLAAAGADLKNPEFLRAHLVPIVATGSDRVADVSEAIKRWAVQTGVGVQTEWDRRLAQRTDPDPISMVLRADRRIWAWLVVVTTALVGVLVTWMMGWFHMLSPLQQGPSMAQPDIPLPVGLGGGWQSRLQDIAIRLVFALPVVFFGLLLVGWRRAAGDRLVRRAGDADWSELFTLAAERVRWFTAGDASRLFEALKLRLITLTDRIDVPASVQATLHAGLSPDVRYQTAEERANYVVLVDWHGVGDHVRLLLQSLVASFVAAKIRFTVYEFRGRPGFCSPTSVDPVAAVAVPFTVLAKRHAGERLLLISDGEGLFEPPGWRALRGRRRKFVRPGTPVAEISSLRDFGHAVLLTPTPRSIWGQRERMLRDLGFLVVPADAEGINRIGQHIARGGEEFAGDSPADSPDDPFISGLSARALGYASNIPPPPEEIENLVTDLRIWVARTVPDDPLRPGRGFLVLCGVAAFPTIAPGLTLQIAQLLSRAWGEDAPIDSGILSPLARLPWLREGRMPDWLRIALLNSLSEDDFRKIRKLQLVMLAEARPALGPIEAAGLDRIATAFEVAIGKPADKADADSVNEAASRIGQGVSGDEVERIFLAVLHGERLDPVRDVIAPEAPEVIRERLARPERLRRAVWLAVTIAAAGAVALAEPVLAAWVATGWNAFVILSGMRPLTLTIAGFDALSKFGVAANIGGALCLSCWLIAALRQNIEPGARQRFLGRLRYGAMLPVALAAVYVFAKPTDGRMSLLFALSTAVFLCFAPAHRTPGARSAEDMLPQRLEGDDWIATSLGSVVVAVVALGPVLLLALPAFADQSAGFTFQLAVSLIGATTWGFGSRYVRRQLLGPIEGLPTASEQWLDFVAPVLLLLLVAATAPELYKINITLNGREWEKLSPIGFVSITIFGLNLSILTLRLKPNFQKMPRYLAVWVLTNGLLVQYVGTTLYLGDHFRYVPFYFFLTAALGILSLSWSLAALRNQISVLKNMLRIGFIVGWSCIWFLLIIVCLDSIPVNYFGSSLVFGLALIPSAASFWPNIKFVMMAKPSTEPILLRMRTLFGEIIRSPWWFVLMLWAVDQQYETAGISIVLTPLAVPLACIAGWRRGTDAVIPVLVGSLPFIAHASLGVSPTITTPGGFWPLVALPLLARICGDEALRNRIVARSQASLWDCGLFVVCLATAVPKLAFNPAFAFSIDPSWLAVIVGFLVGLSRIRWRGPATTFALSVLLVGYSGYALGLEASGLSATAFFGGRVWRSLVLHETAGIRRIRVGGGIALMLCAAGVAFGADIAGRMGNLLGAARAPADLTWNSQFILALVGGIVVRKLLKPALVIWTIVILMLGSAPGLVVALGPQPPPLDLLSMRLVGTGVWAGGGLVWSIAFALFGYVLGRCGEPAYARALGLVSRSLPMPRDHDADGAGGAGRGDSAQPVAA